MKSIASAQYNQMVASLDTLIQEIHHQSDQVADGAESSQQTNKATEEVAQAITGIAQVTTSQAQETSNSVTRNATAQSCRYYYRHASKRYND